MGVFTRLFPSSGDSHVTSMTVTVAAISAITTLALITVSRQAFQGKQEKIIRSPRVTLLPKLTAAEKSSLAYPPDILPGGRDVDSPYGTIRVYEWGPEEGRKVLLVHGISTPCLSLGAVAHGLVEQGCRVILFDLWGRGYSDSCADLEYDDRLYATEILLALTSSPLSWTGGVDGGFSLVGYSLGGGIAVSFASYFPNMVKSLVLLAPAGLIRPQHMSFTSRFLYSSGLIPETLLLWLVKRRLKAGPLSRKPKRVGTTDALTAEIEGNALNSRYSNSLSKQYKDVTLEGAVAWQLDANVGYVHSFMSSIRFSPITGQQTAWRQLGLRADKTLMFGGATDSIIIPSELKEDAEGCLGKEKIEWRLIDGAHDFPATHSAEVIEEISAFWKL